MIVSFAALAVADLGGLGGQPVRVAAELSHAGFKGVAGAGRFLEEEHIEGLGTEQVIVIGAGEPLTLEVIGQIEGALELVEGPVFGGDEVLAEQLGLHGYS
jgi:hypothetical protein